MMMNNNHFPNFVHKNNSKPMAERIKLFEKFGIVDLRDPKNSDTLMQLLSERVSEHILRCKQKNLPATHPIFGSPLDEAEIEFILFHKCVFQTYKYIPDIKEIEANYNKICIGEMNQELFGFARAFIDISFFIDEKTEVNYERLHNLCSNEYKQNQEFFEYLELKPEMLENNKKTTTTMIFEDKKRKRNAQDMKEVVITNCSHKKWWAQWFFVLLHITERKTIPFSITTLSL